MLPIHVYNLARLRARKHAIPTLQVQIRLLNLVTVS
jgi:hypothetical protein